MLFISSIASQFWCEIQVELERKYGKISNEKMKKGKKIHKDLHSEIFDVVSVEVKTPVDRLYSILHSILIGLSQYEKNGVTREFPVFFKFQSMFIYGVIDEIGKVKEGRRKKIQVIETKTRSSNKKPSPAMLFRDKIQGMLYWYGLKKLLEASPEEIMEVNEIYNAFGVKPDEMALSKEFIESADISPKLVNLKTDSLLRENIVIVYKKAFMIGLLPGLSNQIKLNYICQDTREKIYDENYGFDPEFFEQKIKWALDYWLEKRKPMPVGEKNRWKCNFCGYKSMCSVFS